MLSAEGMAIELWNVFILIIRISHRMMYALLPFCEGRLRKTIKVSDGEDSICPL